MVELSYIFRWKTAKSLLSPLFGLNEMQCSKRGVCACLYMRACVCVFKGVSNQCALSTNEGREGPPVQGRWVESSEIGFGGGGCVGIQ